MSIKLLETSVVVVACCCLVPVAAIPCTSILVTPGASSDGSTMITYAADSHVLYGMLEHRPARSWPRGATRKIFDWDSGKFRGTIPQARRTYKVVGHINEHQLVIAETTFGGRKELRNKKGVIDYGSLMFIALERAKTAPEAIKIMTDLVAKHGYGSGGESFSIGDPTQAWILEMIGKGPGVTGAVWVACRVPDGHISGHANQARIRRFPLNDPRRCVYSEDVIAFARSKGYFKGKDGDFSFARTYQPPSFTTRRMCDARVWSVFRRASPSLKLSSDWAEGKPHAKPLPLTIKPDRGLSVRDVMALMRDHFDGTPLDLRSDVGAGPYRLPYRWRPLTWKVDGNEYFNERAISTQQTGFSFVSQSRRWLPSAIGGLLWFGVDDTASTVYVPIHAGITRVPRPLARETASFTRFSWNSAFWVFNFVAHIAYLRYVDAIEDIRKVQTKLESGFFAAQSELEQKAQKDYKRSAAAAGRLLTRAADNKVSETVARWRLLGQQLLMKYLDGNVRDAKGKVTHPGYPAAWYRRVACDAGKRYRVRPLPGEKRSKKKKGARPAGGFWSSDSPPDCRLARPHKPQ